MIHAARTEGGKPVHLIYTIRMEGRKHVPSTVYLSNYHAVICTFHVLSHESRAHIIHESQFVDESRSLFVWSYSTMDTKCTRGIVLKGLITTMHARTGGWGPGYVGTVYVQRVSRSDSNIYRWGKRLDHCNEFLQLGLSYHDIDAVVQEACFVASRIAY